MCRVTHAPVARLVGRLRRGYRATHIPTGHSRPAPKRAPNSIRPCRTSPPDGRNRRVASAPPLAPATEATVAPFRARLRSSPLTEVNGPSRSQRRSFSYGSARPLPRARPTRPPFRDRAAPEGTAQRDRSTLEQALSPSGSQSEPDATPPKAEAPEGVFRRNETPAGAASPHTRERMAWAATLRPKSASHSLPAPSPPQAAVPAVRQPGLRSRSHMRAHRSVRAGTSEDARLFLVTRTPRDRDWLTPGNRRRLPEVRCLSAKSVTVVGTRRFTSPTPSALRVSHPLSGLLPPRPCGFVSRHIRS
jgi:hypothetical protein